jgi:hypothetical protein
MTTSTLAFADAARLEGLDEDYFAPVLIHDNS